MHSWSIFGARTSDEQLELTRLTKLTTAWIWGKPPPSPLKYTLGLSTGATSKWLFVPRLPSGRLEIRTAWTLLTLGVHNFVSRPPIEMRSKVKL
jgi:hypothetical protein